MKFLIPFLLLCSLPAFAQVDAKLNVGSALFGGLGVAADIGLNEQSSFSAGIGYSGIGFSSDEDDFTYRNLRFVPEYRYYFNPRRGADRFFAGAYGKLGKLTAKDKSDDDNKVDATRAALGIMIGNKWVSEGGFVFEINAGFGRGTTFGGGDGDAEYERAIGVLTSYDVRLGIIAGYRFQ